MSVEVSDTPLVSTPDHQQAQEQPAYWSGFSR